MTNVTETDVVNVLIKDGVSNINWEKLRKYENISSINLDEIRNEFGMGSLAVRIAYNELFGGVLIQQQPGEGNRKHYHPDADENGFRKDVIKLVTDLNMLKFTNLIL